MVDVREMDSNDLVAFACKYRKLQCYRSFFFPLFLSLTFRQGERRFWLGTMVDDMFIDTPQFEFEAQGTVELDSEGNLPFDSVGSNANDGEDVRKS